MHRYATLMMILATIVASAGTATAVTAVNRPSAYEFDGYDDADSEAGRRHIKYAPLEVSSGELVVDEHGMSVMTSGLARVDDALELSFVFATRPTGQYLLRIVYDSNSGGHTVSLHQHDGDRYDTTASSGPIDCRIYSQVIADSTGHGDNTVYFHAGAQMMDCAPDVEAATLLSVTAAGTVDGVGWIDRIPNDPGAMAAETLNGPRFDEAAATEPRTAVARSSDQACPDGQVEPHQFNDVDGNVHGDAISCLVWWDITHGTGDGTTYSPNRLVTQGQMATFLIRLITAVGGTVPQAPFDSDVDYNEPVHADSLHRLRAYAGLHVLHPSGDEPVLLERTFMAVWMQQVHSAVTGRPLGLDDGDYFTDDDDVRPWVKMIDRVAQAGVSTGVGNRRYDPAGHVNRAQMATFLTRLIDAFADTRTLAYPS